MYCSDQVLPFIMVCGIVNGMTLKIDKAGRIILPKPVRDRLHLREGSELVVEEQPGCLTLRPLDRKTPMLLEKGFWVHQGQAPAGFDWGSIVDSARDERIKDASGL